QMFSPTAKLTTILKKSHLCPRSLDCARARRHFCQPGSSHCGPCLHPFIENSRGRCFCHTSLFSSMLFSLVILHLGITKALSARSLSSSPYSSPEQSRIMSSSKTYRSSEHSLPLTLCMYFFSAMSTIFIVAGTLALIMAGACWPGDKKLAHSAQMYHYQHQKQQMLSLEKHRDELKGPDSGASTDEENDDGDFTVYECPGLAPTGEMEVKNPLFDDSTLYLQRFHK
uniref:Neural proliferation, differentiation and control, 1b n=1 Tax=Echeneis naucrates TaxID=173247 RepID=A0A665TQB4_ECHNA